MSDNKIVQNKKSVRSKKKKEDEEGNEVEEVIIDEGSITVSKNLEDSQEIKSKEVIITKPEEASVASDIKQVTIEERKESIEKTVENKPLRKQDKPKNENEDKFTDKGQKCNLHSYYPWLIAIGVFVSSLIIYNKLR